MTQEPLQGSQAAQEEQDQTQRRWHRWKGEAEGSK